MIGIASLPRDIQKLADAKGWEEDELLEFLQEEGEKLDGTTPDEQDEDDPNLDD